MLNALRGATSTNTSSSSRKGATTTNTSSSSRKGETEDAHRAALKVVAVGVNRDSISKKWLSSSLKKRSLHIIAPYKMTIMQPILRSI